MEFSLLVQSLCFSAKTVEHSTPAIMLKDIHNWADLTCVYRDDKATAFYSVPIPRSPDANNSIAALLLGFPSEACIKTKYKHVFQTAVLLADILSRRHADRLLQYIKDVSAVILPEDHGPRWGPGFDANTYPAQEEFLEPLQYEIFQSKSAITLAFDAQEVESKYRAWVNGQVINTDGPVLLALLIHHVSLVLMPMHPLQRELLVGPILALLMAGVALMAARVWYMDFRDVFLLIAYAMLMHFHFISLRDYGGSLSGTAKFTGYFWLSALAGLIPCRLTYQAAILFGVIALTKTDGLFSIATFFELVLPAVIMYCFELKKRKAFCKLLDEDLEPIEQLY